jgi:type II secretory pathway pseudopilin PulG
MIRKIRIPLSLKTCLILAALTVLSLSCNKEKQLRRRAAGTWTYDKMIRSYYSNNHLDSIQTITSGGSFVLTNNNHYEYNKCHYKIANANSLAIGVVANQTSGLSPKEDDCYWTTDETTGDRMTIWSDNGFGTCLLFSRTSESSGKEEWNYIVVDANGNMSVKEVYSMSHSK